MSGSSICRNAAIVGTLVASLAPVHALDGERAMSQYIRDQWGVDKGFPGGPVYEITQSSDGYLWMAAEKGLVRFDGQAFRLFEPKGVTTASGPTALGVTAAPDGSVWARLRGVGLVRHHAGGFENLFAKIAPWESVVTAMAPARDGVIVLATLGRGVLTYRDDRFEPIASAQDVPSSSFVVAIAAGRPGEFWLGTRDAGLLRVEGTRVTRVTDGLPDLKINCLLGGDEGEVWIGTDKGIARWSGTEITQSGLPPLLHRTPAIAMIRDRASNVWISTGSRGLVRINREGVAIPSDTPERATRYVSTMFEDRDGNLWLGTDRGIERWRDPVFTAFTSADGVPRGGVGPVYVDDEGRSWFAPTNGGLYWIQNGVVGRVTQDGLADDVIYSIDGGGNDVWVGRQRGGVTRLRTTGSRWAAARFTQSDGLAQDNVSVVTRARDGAVWAGTLSGGATRFKDGVFSTFNKASGLASNTVASIVEGSDGTMWFATPTGLSALSRGGWRTYTRQDGLPSDAVSALHAEPSGVLWIGTDKGLAVIEGNRTRGLASAPAALHGAILGVAVDGRGFLWVNTPDRVFRVIRDSLLHDAVDAADVREFGAADGLPSIESVKRHRTIVTDRRGRVWVATTNGIAVADPAVADGRARPALTHIESISADGSAIASAGPIEIPSNRRRVAFGFTGLSLAVPERVRYRYRLDGFDRDWSEATADRQAVYTNLAPGEYRFRVVASNSDGLWNGEEAALPFEIKPMFWQTRWFQAGAVVLGLLAVWGLYRLRLLQLARRLNVRFEERLAERTRIAQELHDTLLQGFLSASMQLHVAADRLPDGSPARRSIGDVLDLMGRVIDEGRNAVRGLRSSTTGHDLEQAFSGIRQELALDQHASYRVIVEGQPRPLNPAVRDEVYRIGREGLVNAFRHAEAAHVEIELDYAPRELRLFVRDDGRGIDPQIVAAGRDGHWGITGMRERAERIGGTLKMRSRPSAGTEVELRVPGRAAFSRASEKHV